MSLITLRTAYQASFINYDYPYEFLVYAHASNGPKIVLDQIEEISRRLTGGLDIKVAYDNHGLYPYWWYLRNYPNKIVYLENPTRSLEDAEIIIAGSDKYDKIDTIARDNYYVYEYMRLWWPMQDYMGLNWERISSALSSADMRQALFNIWLNRDYTLYAQTANNPYLTLDNWLPSERMRLYIRKDVAAKMWQLNTEASIQQEIVADPYAEKTISRQADFFIGMSGSNPGELNTPHGIDIAPDGSIFVADSGNNRIQKFSPDGTLLASWGTYANILESDAPGGTLNEPWDVAVGQDGSVYVADTFNHRIQKFSADGKFIKMWGIFAQGDDPQDLWGPRGIAIDPQGNVLVTDTGNKRVLVFDKNLNFITQFGGTGFEAGQFDEPVGIAVSPSGQVVVADTWNRRVQIFEPDESGLNYTQVGAFDIEAWYGTGINNKPYITVSPDNTIVISDPEGGRVLEFSMDGEFISGLQDISPSTDIFSQPYDLAYDHEGNLWVSDAGSSLLLRFSPAGNE
jgi:DNA-binding beta-propeller fold protein YncE